MKINLELFSSHEKYIITFSVVYGGMPEPLEKSYKKRRAEVIWKENMFYLYLAVQDVNIQYAFKGNFSKI